MFDVIPTYLLIPTSIGSYAGFDETEPTSQQDGKAQVVAYLKHLQDYQRVVMVGDGVTDLEACPPAVRLEANATN